MPRPCNACNEVTEQKKLTDEELAKEGRRLLDAAVERNRSEGSIQWKRWNVFVLEHGHRFLELVEQQFRAPSNSMHFENQELEDLRSALGIAMSELMGADDEAHADMAVLDKRIQEELARRG